MAPAARKLTWRFMSRMAGYALVPALPSIRRRLRMICHPLLIVLIADISDIDPGMRHFIDGTIAPSHPLLRIGIVGAGCRIIVPRHHVDNRTLRQHWRRIVGVNVVSHPVEVKVIHVAERALGSIGKYGFEQHRLAAQVHMGLEILQTCG